MNKTVLTVNNGKWRMNAIKTDRHKMSRLSFHFILPKDARRSPMTKLMLAVMLRGSEKYPTVTDINTKLDELYDTTVSLGSNSFGNKSVFTLSCKIIGDRFVFDGDDTDILAETIDVVANILTSPLLDENGLLCESYVEGEKRIAIDAIKSLINDQRAYAAKKCTDKMFGDSPYGITTAGDVDTVASFTAHELTENIEYFKQNALVECYYIGAEGPCRIAELISDRFDGFTAVSANAEYSESAFVSPRNDIQRACESMDVSQTRICMGYTCDTTLCDDDYFAMVVANELFGGSSVSKLFLNVREKKSLCYYCSSVYKSASGIIRVECGVAPQNADAAIAEIAHQLEEFCRGNLTDSEIQTAKSSLASGFKQISDSAAATEAFMFRRLLGGSDQTIESCIESIKAVDRESILRAAKKIKLDTVFVLEGSESEEDCDDE